MTKFCSKQTRFSYPCTVVKSKDLYWEVQNRNILYIEPETTLKYIRELSNLEYEETEEINRILKQLSNDIRPFYRC
jgi:hypothetical protein